MKRCRHESRQPSAGAASPGGSAVWARGWILWRARAPGIRNRQKALIERSQQLVRDLAAEPYSLLIAGPSKRCPHSIQVAALDGTWVSGRDALGQTDVSGTWSTIGMAAGLGVPVLLYLPPSIGAPPWLGAWQWQFTGADGWWLHGGAR